MNIHADYPWYRRLGHVMRRRFYRARSIIRRQYRAIYLRIPAWIRDRDFEIFTAALCFSAGVPLLVTREVRAASLEAAMPFAVVIAWSVVLTFAPIAIVTGLWQSHRHVMRDAVYWMRLESLGLYSLAIAAYLYAFSILLVVGLGSVPAVAIIAAFALTCHSRAVAVTLKVEDYKLSIGAGDG